MEALISQEQVNILLVDDRPENITALEVALTPLGYNLVSVNSGEAALREVLRKEFAVIIMDILMPGLDGYDTANMLKARFKSQFIPIIFVSASGDEPLKSYTVGAVDYMCIPFNPEILRAKVRAFVELYKVRQELATSKLEVEKARTDLEFRVLERTQTLTKEIAERIKTEAALRESENKFRKLFENSNDAIFIHTMDGLILDANHQAESMVGYSLDALKTMGVPALHPPEELEISKKSFEETISKGFTRFESRFRRSDGGLIDVDISARIADSERGIIQGIVRDITERKIHERKLNETNQKLQQALDDINVKQKMLVRQEKLAAMGQLSAGVAHELKNPLNIIYTSTQLMMMEEGLTSEVAESGKIIMEQVMRAVKIIDNLRDFARERKPETKEIDLCPFIEKTLRLVAYEMKGEGIEIENDCPPETIRSMGDVDQLAQVFLNITNNARDSINMRKKSYSFEESEKIDWKAKLIIRTRVEKSKVKIRFEDNGVGISEENKRKLFTPFFTTKGETTGTGLGIAIALGIIENHGGTIEFESEEGKGAIFTVTLPLLGG